MTAERVESQHAALHPKAPEGWRTPKRWRNPRSLGSATAFGLRQSSAALMSVEDYLAWEETQPEKHEHVAGMVYAMAGGTTAHAAIAMNVGASLHGQLRIDELEKRGAYQSIATLRVYILLDQEKAGAVVWRRGEQGFTREVHSGLEAIVPLPAIEAQLPLAAACQAVSGG